MFLGRQNDLTGVRPLRVRNDAGEEIPAYAAMLISGVASDGVFLVDQPTAANMTDRIIFNGPTAIPATVDNGNESAAKGEGTAFIGFPAIALCHPSDAAPAVNDNWGTAANGWKLRKNNTGFVALGNLLTTSVGHYAQVTAADNTGGASFEDDWELSSNQSITTPGTYSSGVVITFTRAGLYLVTGKIVVKPSALGTSIISDYQLTLGSGATSLGLYRGQGTAVTSFLTLPFAAFVQGDISSTIGVSVSTSSGDNLTVLGNVSDANQYTHIVAYKI